MAIPPDDLAHLLRRTESRPPPPERVAALGSLDLADVVDDILNVDAAATTPANLTTHASSGWQQYVDACDWWIEQMVSRPQPFLEKMVQFWHGHFVSACWDVDQGFHVMRQLQTYRANALGNLETLAKAMAIDPAMLVYLSNADNVKATPNENFAREMMELFLLGANNGYTQDDVRGVARTWTGHNALWNQDPNISRTYIFQSSKHDYAIGRTTTEHVKRQHGDRPDCREHVAAASWHERKSEILQRIWIDPRRCRRARFFQRRIERRSCSAHTASGGRHSHRSRSSSRARWRKPIDGRLAR